MKMLKVRSWNTLIAAMVMAMLAFGAQTALSASDARAAEAAAQVQNMGINQEMGAQGVRGADENAEFQDDEELLEMALRLKLLGRDLEKVMKNDNNVARLLDRDINKDILKRDDLAKSLALQEQLLAKTDEFGGLDGFSSGGSENRIRFNGVIDSMPAGLQGTWVIGGQALDTVPGTQFDQLEGPLTVGGCAKVDIRNGLVHEIDSQELGDCPGAGAPPVNRIEVEPGAAAAIQPIMP